MANECQVFEMAGLRGNIAVRTVPFLAKQTLSSGGTSAAFNGNTHLVTIISSLAGTLEFSSLAADPTGSGVTFPINANQEYDWHVRPATKVKFT